MLQKSLGITLLLLSSTTFAYTPDVFKCPSVQDIKNGDFHSWIPLYKDNEEQAFRQEVSRFRTYVTDFEVARWSYYYQESGHCFYRGTDPIVEKIVFAQDAWRPVNNPTWFWATPNRLAECYSINVDDCEFLG